jgi:hypothetical protein
MGWLIMTAKDFTGICGVPILDLLTPTSQQRKMSEQTHTPSEQHFAR